MDPGSPGDYKYGGSVFVNEAAFGGGAPANNHHKRDDPSAHNSLNALLLRSARRPRAGPQPRAADTGFFYQPSGPEGEGPPSPASGETDTTHRTRTHTHTRARACPAHGAGVMQP